MAAGRHPPSPQSGPSLFHGRLVSKVGYVCLSHPGALVKAMLLGDVVKDAGRPVDHEKHNLQARRQTGTRASGWSLHNLKGHRL